MSKKDENIIEEKVFNVPLTRAHTCSVRNRMPSVIRVLRSFITRHMKTEDVAISKEVNEEVWKRGVGGSPRHLRVRATKSKDGRVTVYLVAKGESTKEST
ncbi:60S ribosomal protein L31 [Candidatus Bathyarchaeota archaeon]|jgi:large subunit ribosomal protein L31e|nr:60S ribosomal protein L31 [Candidatus Bathyarchaeota archaeon]